MAEWWVSQGGGDPVGPMTTERILQSIRSGSFRSETFVIEVGGTDWRSIREVGRFASAFGGETTSVDTDYSSLEFDDKTDIHKGPPRGEDAEPRAAEPRTLEPALPLVRQTRPPLQRFDDTEEHTVVDQAPRESDPP